MVALIWQAKSLPAQTKEPPLWVNGELARASRDKLHDLPLLVLSAGIPGKVEDPKLEDLKRTQELHAELARLSMKGRRRIVTNSSHRMIFEAPGSITEAARQIIGEARRERPKVTAAPGTARGFSC
jgi:hypothetical protein